MKNILTCPFCENSHEWKKAKHFIAFFCPDMGIIHWTHYTREEVEEAKKEMQPVNWKTALIQGFFQKRKRSEMTTLKRCFCGKFARHGSWIKPDKIQLEFISTGLTKKEVQIENTMCDVCTEAYTGFGREKVSQR